jgi:flagellum-specific ATP synthase
MTTRLTRWLTTLDNFEAKMAQLPAVRRYGRLTRATGLVLEATGLQLPLGATCVIERQNGSETHEVESEVVGFNGQRLFLMPLEEVEGVLPGARVYAKNISAEGLQSGKQLPLGPALLGRVLDGSGKPLDGLPSPDTTETGALITPPFNPLQRTPIEHVLDTGVRPINALLTVGRGQRMGLFAGSGVGKSVLLAMLSNGFFQRLDKLLIVDPAVAGHPGTHIAIEVIAIFILIIDQHFELFFRLLTSATHFTQQARGILYLFFCQIFQGRQRTMFCHLPLSPGL